MIFTKFNDNLPDWVRENIKMVCPYCNSLLVDNSDGPSGMTARWCPNSKCPGHMQYKIDAMAKKLGVKDFGPASALTYIRINHCESHLDILDSWLHGAKPVLPLSDIADLACIEGYSSTTGKKELNSFKSFDDYFHNATNVNAILWHHRDVLFKAESYFTVAKPLARRKMLVMAHGSFNKFNSRGEFFKEVNEAFGEFIQIIEVGVRKTGVSYLIIDNGVSHSGQKYKAAVETGVPIVTPEEFVNILTGYVHS